MITGQGLIRICFRFGVLLSNGVLFGVAARRFNPVDMGIWSLASSITMIVLSLDLGISNFVRNQVIACREKEQEIFSTGVLASTGLAGIYLILILVTSLWLPPGAVDSKGIQIALPSLMMSMILLVIRLPSAIAVNCFFSFNEANRYALVEFATVSVSVFAALALLALGLGVRYVLFGFYGVGTLVGCVALVYFIRRRRWRVTWEKRIGLAEVAKGAWPFGLLQIVGLGLNSMPAFAIGSLVGIEGVTGVRAAIIIGQAALSLHLAHSMPLWTAFSRIHTTAGSSRTIADLKNRLLKEAVALGFVFLAIAAISPPLINFWVGRPVSSFPLCLGFSLWAWGCGVVNLYSMVLNGRGRAELTAIAILPGIVLIAAFARLPAMRWGSAGVGAIFATGAAISAVLTATFAVREIRRMSRSLAGI